jgi:hypothetical protein
MAAACLAAATCLVWGVTANAEPFWKNVLRFRRVEADRSQEYRLAEEHGPWLILAATFSGEGAEKQAQSLVHELREQYKLLAYLHDRRYDYTQRIQGLGVDEFGAPVRMKYNREKDIREFAVLVGDFSSVDGNDVQKALRRIKSMHPTSLEVSAEKPSYQILASYRSREKAFVYRGTSLARKIPAGPMGTAFVVRNPMLPVEYFAPKGLDPLVVKMNKKAEYSLLDCPGRYTVKVATFNGSVVLDPKAVKQIEAGARLNSRLEKAALDAHELTIGLRAKGYEAYEFHDLQSSIVTVGSFDSVGTPRADGKIEINPAVHQLMKTFGAERKFDATGQASVGGPKSMGGIPFDVQPMPVEVPKPSISSDYNRPLLGLRDP